MTEIVSPFFKELIYILKWINKDPMRIACMALLLMLLIVCTGCMGISAPAVPKIQPLAVNIEKNNAQMIDRTVQTPVPSANITITATPTKSKIVFV